MKVNIRLLVIFMLMPLFIGCAYVNDSRVYSIQPAFSEAKAQQIAKVVEAKLIQRGLILKSKYHDTYPEDIAVTVFEIPRLPDEKRRDPLFIVYIKSGSVIQLKHSEWWLNRSNRPNDYIRDITPDLVSAIKNVLGCEIQIVLTKEKLY